MRKLSTTSFAILGLLAVRPWSTYELTQQVRKSLGRWWSKSERLLYNQPKILVEHGFAIATTETVGRRARTVYEITPAGARRCGGGSVSPRRYIGSSGMRSFASSSPSTAAKRSCSPPFVGPQPSSTKRRGPTSTRSTRSSNPVTSTPTEPISSRSSSNSRSTSTEPSETGSGGPRARSRAGPTPTRPTTASNCSRNSSMSTERPSPASEIECNVPVSSARSSHSRKCGRPPRLDETKCPRAPGRGCPTVGLALGPR